MIVRLQLKTMQNLLRSKNAMKWSNLINNSIRSCSYQYLHKSNIPTLHFQRSLPRLPVPALDKTCDRFLNAVRPLLSDKDFEETQKNTTFFKSDIGTQLQSILLAEDAANKETSYISEPWFDMYLSDRSPLPVNYNPLVVMKSDSRPQYQDQLVRATNLVISSLRFWRSLQNNVLDPEIYHMNPKKSKTKFFENVVTLVPSRLSTYAAYAFKAFPLDMSQYNKLFGVTRIPSIGKDTLHKSVDSKHIVVLKGGFMYTVNVLNDSGEIEKPSIILGRLKKVESLAKQTGANKFALGVLTSQNRDEWASIRNHLEFKISIKNKDLMQNKLDTALFCLCLDDNADPVYNSTNLTPLLKHLLSGTGSNRWFDKSLSLIISSDGTASVNFEHSWGDGVAVLRYINEIYADSLKNPFVSTESVPEVEFDSENVLAMDFDTDDHIRQCILKANQNNISIVDDLEINMYQHSDVNKTICKAYGLSPDFVMQLSFQLAYRIVYGDYVGTYESCSTAAFLHGRTETMRPLTALTKELCENLLQSEKYTNSILIPKIKMCSANHTQLVKEAAMGQGFDRHLFALKNIAQKQNFELPSVFNTEGYKRINYNILSTSTLSSDSILAGAFGPVVKDGFGIGYAIQNNDSGAIVTSYKTKRNGMSFIEGFEMAQKHIKKLITTAE